MSMSRHARGSAVATLIAVGLAGCGERGANQTPDPNAPDANEPDAPQSRGPLGMNDITMLMPLPAGPDQPSLLRVDGGSDAASLIARDLFDRVVSTDSLLDYTTVQVLAVRFDLCQRDTAAPCDVGTDGELRLVIQDPFSQPEPKGVPNAALHALYAIPAKDLPAVIDELHALADIAGIPTTSPLMVHPAVTASATYRDRLRALVAMYARPERLHRLARSIAVVGIGETWTFSGVSVAAGVASDLQTQSAFTRGQGFNISPVTDQPAGLELGFDAIAFSKASQADRMQAMQAVVAAENPTSHGFQDLRCVACHMSAAMLADDAFTAGVDPKALPGRFSSTYDLSATEGDFHGLGYFGKVPVTSQRAVNETARVLAEIEARFPPTR